MHRRNPEITHCEAHKSVRDLSGVPRTIEVVALVDGVARAPRAANDFTRHLTEEEKKSGIFFTENTHHGVLLEHDRRNFRSYIEGTIFERLSLRTKWEKVSGRSLAAGFAFVDWLIPEALHVLSELLPHSCVEAAPKQNMDGLLGCSGKSSQRVRPRWIGAGGLGALPM